VVIDRGAEGTVTYGRVWQSEMLCFRPKRMVPVEEYVIVQEVVYKRCVAAETGNFAVLCLSEVEEVIDLVLRCHARMRWWNAGQPARYARQGVASARCPVDSRLMPVGRYRRAAALVRSVHG